jgi:hypothetical protein
LGLDATCNAGGAGHWTIEHADELRNAEVVILPDNDEAGRRHADKIGRSLEGLAKSRKLLELPNLPEHGDIIDWLNAGGTKEQFEQLPRIDWKAYYEDEDDDKLIWHGDTPPTPPPWLVRNRIPEVGIGLIAGQWGTFKSFIALDLCGSVVTGLRFNKEQVYRRGGVLYIAAEGGHSLTMRLSALIEHKLAKELEHPDLLGPPSKINLDRLPVCWTTRCPPLKHKQALPSLLRKVRAAQTRLQEQFGLDLVLIIIDTLAASASWKDENDSAEAVMVMGKLRELSIKAHACVVGVDHYGKVVAAGTRGTSAKEDNVDFVLAVLGNRQEDGSVEDLRLATRKLRDGPQGEEFPFDAPTVDMGQDENSHPLTSRIINWNVVRPERQPRKPTKPPSQQILETVLTESLDAKGELIRVNGTSVRAVRRDVVRDRFKTEYQAEVPDAGDGAVRQRFSDTCKRAGLVNENVDGIEYLRWPF